MKIILGPVALILLALALAVFWPRAPENPGQVEPAPEIVQDHSAPAAPGPATHNLLDLPGAVEQASTPVAASDEQGEAKVASSVNDQASIPLVDKSPAGLSEDYSPALPQISQPEEGGSAQMAAVVRGTPGPAPAESASTVPGTEAASVEDDPYSIVSPEEAHMQTLVPPPPRSQIATVAGPGTLHIGRSSPAWQALAMQEQERQRALEMIPPERPALP